MSRVPLKNYRAKIRTADGRTNDVVVQSDTMADANRLIRATYPGAELIAAAQEC